MNWKTRPELFANGKFRVQVLEQGYVGAGNDYSVENIVGIMFNDEIETNKKSGVRLNNCTLIARPISDMTDEECAEIINKASNPEFIRTVFEEQIERFSMPFDVVLMLLSIGVYPFEDETDVEFQPNEDN